CYCNCLRGRPFPCLERIRGECIMSRLLRRPQAQPGASDNSTGNKNGARNEAPPVDDNEAAKEIAAKLRAQIPCSTDPGRLEKMGREAEAKARSPVQKRSGA